VQYNATDQMVLKLKTPSRDSTTGPVMSRQDCLQLPVK